VAEMNSRGLRRAWLVGGGKLAASFRAEGLITEHIVSVIPVLLGAGIPLFDGRGARETLRLASTKSFDNGIVQLRYLV
jgi:dihydrofolate reductase